MMTPKPGIWITVVVLLLLINIATLTFLWLQYKSPERPGAGLAAKDFIIKKVGLTILQQHQYDSLRVIHRRGIFAINEENRRLHDRLFENVKVQFIDSLLLDSIVLKISHLEVSKQKITLYHFRDLRNILTSGQQIKFDKILSEVLLLVGRPRRPGEKLHPPHKDGVPPPVGEPEVGPPPGDGDDHLPPPGEH